MPFSSVECGLIGNLFDTGRGPQESENPKRDERGQARSPPDRSHAALKRGSTLRGTRRDRRRLGAREGDFEEDEQLFRGDDDGVGDVQARLIYQRHIVLEVEEQVSVNRAHGRNDIGIEREGTDGVERFVRFFVADRRHADGKASLARSSGSVGVRNISGDLSGREGLDAVHAAVLVVDVEFDGIEADLNRVVRVIAQENFDGQNSGFERIGFAKNMFRARGVGERRGGDGEASVLVVRPRGIEIGRGGLLRRSGKNEQKKQAGEHGELRKGSSL